MTGIFSSLAEKKISNDVKKHPPEISEKKSLIEIGVNVIARGSSPSSPSPAASRRAPSISRWRRSTSACLAARFMPAKGSTCAGAGGGAGGGGGIGGGGGGGGGRNLRETLTADSNKPLAW